ncbi:hypothetical protein HJG60_012217 [Phyllostomus discolor]|uniref:Uncharacterized protein n=1 Tax=Phyllostomus discolor TaxID=89673 RepID=A0A834DP71_9CHIR|nr:hypothetical protein HJG60_012217 [Phyllostomus discolor]
MTFWVSLYGSSLEVYFVRYEYCYPGFFLLSICLENLFPALHFHLCRSFILRWVSCRQHMCGSCFLIQSAILCLLIGAFSPFTFKVIIDRYLFIAFYVRVILSHSLFSFLSLKQSLQHLLQSWFSGGVFF